MRRVLFTGGGIKLSGIFLFVFLAGQSFATTYTSNVAVGNWSNPASWSPSGVPGAGDVVTILNGNNITVDVASAAATVTINSGGTITASFALTAGTMTVNSGGTYIHNQNGGTIPAATWGVTSNCNITGLTSSTTLLGFNQTFGNFTWDCNGQTNNLYMQSDMTVKNDLTINNSGAPINAANHALRMSNTGTGNTITVSGNLVVNSLGAFKMNNGTGSCIMNVGGNFLMNGGNFTIVTGGASSSVSVAGNVNLLGGTFEMQEDPSAFIGTLNVSGDFTNSGGAISASGGSGATGSIVFNKAGTQTYTSGGTTSNTVNLTVNSGTTLQMAASGTVVNGGTFLLSAGATLGVTSAAGITTAGATGNIQTTTRTYTAGANYIYNGGLDQATGNGLTANTPADITINDPGFTVTLSGATSLSGNLNVSAGTLATNNVTLSLATGETLAVSAGATLVDGTTSITWGGGGGTANINGVFKTANTTGFSGAAGTAISSTNAPTVNLAVGSTVEYTVLAGGQTVTGRTYDNLILDNTSSTNTAGGNITVNAALTTAAGTFAMGTNLLNGTLTTITNGGTIKTSSTNATPIPSGKTWGGTIEYGALSGSQTAVSGTYNNLLLDNTSGSNTAGGNLTVNGVLTTTVGGTLDMGANVLNGTLSTISNGGTIKTSSTSGTPLPSGKTWGGTIEYGASAGSQTVVSGTYSNLLLDNTSGSNTAGGNLTVNGTLTTTVGGTLDMGTTNLLGGALTTITNGGTIKTSVPTGTSSVPIPSGKTWGGTIEYGALAGSQTVVSGTYNNLLLDNTSGSNTAGGNLTVNGTLTTTVGGTLDMGTTNLLGGALTTITNGGTIKTSVPTGTSSVSIPSGKTWGGTIEYGALAGSQTVVSGTYNNLLLDNTSGVNTTGGNLTANVVTTASGGTLDIGINILAVTTYNNTGATVKFSGALNGLAIGTGTVEYYGSSQTVTAGIYNNLTINQSSGEAVLGGPVTVSGTLTLSAGNLNLGGYDLTLGSSATISVVTPSASKMIIASGGSEVRKTFTANGSFTFPIGDNSGALEYTPITLNVTGTAYSSAYLGVSVVDAKHPSNASVLNYITRYWDVTQSGITNCVATITGTYVPADINGTEASASAAQLDGPFDQMNHPWVKYVALGSTGVNELKATGATITAGQTSSFTGITGANPTVSIGGGGGTICVGGSVALTSTPVGGDPTIIYSWSPAAGLSATTISNPTANPITTTLYTLTIRDGNGIVATNNTTITVNQPAPVADANVDQTLCNTSTFTLGGNVAAPGTGIWTIQSGPGVVTTPASPTSTVTGVTGGIPSTVTVVRWTITNGVCATTFDDVVLTNNATPSIADAGVASITQCNTSTFTMAAVVPSPGSGTWTVSSGAATITNNTSETTTITGIAPGTSATLRWTVGNGVCATTFDDIVLTNTAPAPVADANVDQTLCNTSTFTLGGNVAAPGTGIWTIQSGPGVVTTPASPTSTVTGVTGGIPSTVTVVRWTITNGVCATTFDDVVLTNNATPSIADAGVASITQCNTSTFTMAAVVPSPGSGTWTVSSGAATITNNTSETTTITGIAPGTSATLRWTVGNGVCATTFDDIVLTNTAPAPVADANVDQTLCNTSTFTLGGNVAAPGTGIWTIQSGPGVVTTPASPTSTVTGVTGGIPSTVTVVRWTITNGVCATTFDDVVLTNNATPSIADAGVASITQCNTSTFTMAAVVPSPGSGTWTVSSGAATITNNTSETTTITGIAPGTSATLRWTVGNGVCATTFDDIVLTNTAPAPVADANVDQTLCNTSTFTLGGNVAAPGTGIWTIQSGPGVVTTPASPTSTVTGVTGGIPSTVTVVRWTITNGVCATTFDDVVLTNNATPSIADAGVASITQCNTSTFTMAAVVPSPGSGTWTVSSGAATITNNTSETTTITGIAPGTSATLRWTVGNGVCATTFDDIVLTNTAPAPVADANVDQTLCNTSTFTLGGNVAAPGTGIWTIQSGPGVVTTPASPTSTVTGVTGGIPSTVTVVRWTITNGVCATTFDDVVLTNNATPSIADAGVASITQCNTSTFTMAAVVPSPGSGTWTVSSGAATITNNTSETTTITGIAPGTSATLRWTVGNGVCATTFDDIVLTNTAPAPVADANVDQTLCNTSTFTLGGNVAAPGTGIWTIQSGPGVVTTPASPTSTVTGVTGGIPSTVTVVRWTITNGVCATTFDDVVLTNNATPSIADAGVASITQCNTSTFTMAAVVPSPGSGTWTVSSGAATITNNTSETTTITGIAPGTSATLRWTVGNGVCATTFDDIVLTNTAPAPVADANVDQTLCNTSTFTLGGNVAAPGTGIWTIQSGPGVVTTPASPTSTVTGVTGGIPSTVTVVRWTITNGVCATTFDDVVLTNNATPSIADAGVASITQCNTSTFTMAAVVPSPGSGTWTVSSGAATITNNTSETTTITGIAPGTSATLRWTVGNGVCATTFDDIVLTNTAPAPVADANVDQTLCNTSTFTLGGNVAAPGTGIWTIQSGPGVVTTPASPTSTVTGVTGGIPSTVTVVRWTITNGVCATTFDDVVLTNNATPSIADAGVASITQCNTSTFTMAAVVPSPGSGTWTVSSGAATITNNTSETTTITGIAPGTSATLRWTVGNGVCATTFDDIVLTNTAPAPVADANVDQTLCNTSTFTLGGNVAAPGTGIWTIQSGPGVVTTPASPTSTVTGVTGGIPSTVTVVRWTITNGVCATTFDDVVLTNNATPSIADAGVASITQCNTSTFTMAAVVPSPGSGTWTVSSGAATITNNTSETTTITGIAPGTSATLRWTVGNGVCATTFDDIVLTNTAPAPVADANVDQTLCNTSTFTLGGNVAAPGTGIWTIQSGPGVVTTPASPTSTVTGVTGGIPSTVTVVRWTITNGVCATTFDDVVLTNNATPSIADAGVASITQCNTSTFTMAAVVPSPGSGTWTVSSGAATITNNTSETTTITGIAPGTSATLRWTVGNGVCATTFDDIVLTNTAPAPVADANVDQTLCNTSTFTLGGNVAAPGTGIWTIQSGPGVVTTPASPTSTVTGVTGGIPSTVTVVRWTITNGVCATTFDDVVLTNNATPSIADAGVASITQCNTSTFTMAAVVPSPGSGTWTVSSGAATITNNTSETTTITGIAPGTSATLRWTVGNGVCATTFDDIVLTNTAPAPVADANVDQTLCNTSTFTLGGNVAAPGTGIWTIQSGPGVVTTPASPTSTVTGVTGGIPSTVTVVRWTITNGVCATTFDDVVLTNNATPSIADAGVASITQCNTSTFTMAAVVPSPGSGTWTVSSGAATITNNTSETTTITGIAPGTSATLRWTVGNGVCATTFDDIVLTNTAPAPVADANVDQTLCNTSTFTLGGNVAAPGTGIWTIQSGPGVVTTPASPTSTVTGVTGGIPSTVTVVRWTITNGVCATTFDDVVLTNNATPSIADAGVASITQCNTSTFTMAAVVPSPGSGTWTVSSGAATITNNTSETTTITGIAPGTSATLRWTVGNGVCATTFDDIVLTNTAPAPVADANVDQTLCNTSTFTLGGNVAAPGTGIWTIQSGPGVVTTPASPTSTVTGVTGGIPSTVTVVRWTITNGVCATTFDDVVLTNNATPSIADAGVASITQCNTSTFTMAAVVPSPGSGTWTVSSGAATITNNTSETTTITGIAPGTSATLRWTVGNGVCATTFDDIVLTNTAPAPVADANVDQTLCNTSTFTLGGNVAAPGTGIWTIQSGPGVVTTPASPTSTVTGVTGGIPSTVTVVRWTITNGVCATTFDDVVLTNNATPSIADAGVASITQCNTSTFTMAAVVPSPGSGTWTVSSGAATITNNTSETTTITGIAPGTSATLRWTVGNGVCATTFDDIVLTNTAPAPVADANVDQTLCNTSTFTLGGNVAAPGTGIWTIQSGPGVVTTPASPTSTVTGVTGGIPSTVTVVRWTITNGVCATTFDDVVLTNNATPSIADAGVASITQCNTSTFTMAAVVPSPGSGTWTVSSGAATITNNTSETTTITGIAPGTSATLRWTVGNGVCATTFDDIVLTNTAPAPVADANVDQTLCNTSTFTLGGNVAAPGTGIWTIQSGPGVVTTPASPTSTVTGVTGGIPSTVTVVRWTITNGVCATTFDDVVLTNNATPSIADAGVASITQCNTSTFTMAAVVPSPGSGTWTVSSGAATITNNTSETTTITGIAPGTSATLRWTVGNGVCATTFDDIVLTNSAATPLSDAGVDQTQCNNSTFTLGGNVPAPGTGAWTIQSGPGTVTTPASPTSTVTGVTAGGGPTVIRWTISNGACGSFDEVTLINNVDPFVTVPPDQVLCANTLTSAVTFAGNAAQYGWTNDTPSIGLLASGTGDIPSFTALNPTGSPVIATIKITPTSGICTGTQQSFTITVNPIPSFSVTNNAPTICSGANTNILFASSTAGHQINVKSVNYNGAGNSGTIIPGTTTFVNGNSLVEMLTNVTNVPIDVVYEFDITTPSTTPVCPLVHTSQFITVRVNPVPTFSITNTTGSICSGASTNVTLNTPTTNGLVTLTTVNYNGATGGTQLNGNTFTSGQKIIEVLANPGTTSIMVTYTFSVSANGCNNPATQSTSVTVNPSPVITNSAASLEATICSGAALNFTPSSTLGTTTYAWVSAISGPIVPLSVTSSGNAAITDSPVNNGSVAGTVTYRITPTAGTCQGAPVNYVVTVKPIPTASASIQTICSGTSSNVLITAAPTNVVGTTYTWTVFSSSNSSGMAAGSGATISQMLSSVDGITNGTVTYRITPLANGCAGPTTDVTVTVTPVPVITTTATQLQATICSGVALSFTPTSSIAGTTYSWTSSINGPISAGSVTAGPSGVIPIADAPVNTGNVIGTITYHIIPSNGVCAGIAKDYVVTVQPVPSANGTDITICSGQNAVIAINATPQNVSGTTFSWVVLPTANVTGASNGNGSTINQTLNLTNYSIGSVIYRITPLANGCAGPTKDITVAVDPIASVNAGTDYAVCEPATILLTGSIGGAATLGTWQIVTGGGSISASTVSGTTVTATYTVAPGDITTTVVFKLITDDPDGGALPCNPASGILHVAVNRAPTVALPSDYTVCEPSSISLTGTIGGSASTGLWSVVSGAGVLSATNVSGTTVTANYSVDPSDISNVVIFRLTSNDPDGSGPCIPVFSDIHITINRAAQVFAPANLALCQDTPGIALGGSIGGSTTVTAWSGGLGSFSNINDPNATYNFKDPNEVNTSVVLTITAQDPDGAGPCTQVSTKTNLKINPLPIVVFSGFPPGIPTQMAENLPPITLTGNQIGGLFTISPATSNIGSTSPSPVDKVTFDPSAATLGPSPNVVTYTFTDANGCTNATSQSIIINPVTNVNFTIQTGYLNPSFEWEICANQLNSFSSPNPTPSLIKLIGNPVASTGGAPETNFTASAGTNNPANVMSITHIGSEYYIETNGLPPDTYLVNYTYKNSFGAITFKIIAVIVHPGPQAQISVANNCISSAIQFNDASPPTPVDPIVFWKWDFNDGSAPVFAQNPSHVYTVPKIYKVVFQVSTSFGCTDTTSTKVRVGAVPLVKFNASSICNNDSTKFKDQTSLKVSRITTYSWDFGDGNTLVGDSTTYGLSWNQGNVDIVPDGSAGTFKNPFHKYVTFGTYHPKLVVNTNDGCNNSYQRSIFILPYKTVVATSTNAYTEDFEATDGGYQVEPIPNANDVKNPLDSSWIWTVPNGDVIKGGSKSWWTGLYNGTYDSAENSAVNGPCFNLSALSRPMIAFDYWVNTPPSNYDGAALQYSVNGGIDWFNVGVPDRGNNWYSTNLIVSNPGVQKQGYGPYGWSGASQTQWKRASFNLDTLLYQTIKVRRQVRIRVAFAGDSTKNVQGVRFNGFAFDNVFVGDKTKNVLVEQFTNSTVPLSVKADGYFDNLFANEIAFRGGDTTDFNILQYHVRFPTPDVFGQSNTDDPAARALFYGVQQVPFSTMDGLKTNKLQTATGPLGDYHNINAIEIDRRALLTPALTITQIDTTSTAPTNHTFNVKVTIRADTAITYPLYAQVALIEDPVTLSGITYHNVVRKLLYGGDGSSSPVLMAKNDTHVFSKGNVEINTQIADPTKLFLVVFVQRFNSIIGNQEILQSAIMPVIKKVGSLITGIEPSIAELEQIQIYPNPANGKFSLSTPGEFPNNSIWKISDQRGINVMTGNFNDAFNGVKSVDISSLTNGVYFVAIGAPDRNPVYKKLVVLNVN